MTAPLTVPERVALRDRWSADPVAFSSEVLGITTLWAKQVEALESVRDNRETNVPSGHACGKDFLASILVPWFMLTGEDSLVVTTATKALQVEKILWGEVRARVRLAKVPLGGNLAPASASWSFGEKWYAIGLTAADPNGFAGFHSRRVLLIRDEAAGIAPDIWDASESVASGDDDRILNIGNPICGPVHPFAKACALPDAPGKRKTIRMRSTETPNYIAGKTVVPGLAGRAYVDSMAEKYGRESVLYGARVEGKFPGSASDGLISIEHLEIARNRVRADIQPIKGEIVRLGCDPARYGDDSTIIYAVRGPTAWQCAILSGANTETIGEACLTAARDFYANSISIDATGGYGAGPIDYVKAAIAAGRLPNQECSVHEVNFGSSASDRDQWANRRTELWWRMRDWIIERAAFDADDVIAEELLAATYKPHGEGVALEAKELFKKRIGRSPDRADALSLAISGHEGAVSFTPGESFSAGPSLRDEDLPMREEATWVPASPW